MDYHRALSFVINSERYLCWVEFSGGWTNLCHEGRFWNILVITQYMYSVFSGYGGQVANVC